MSSLGIPILAKGLNQLRGNHWLIARSATSHPRRKSTATGWKPDFGLFALLALGVSISPASAQLNQQQIQIIKDTAASICNTVKEAKGQKSDIQIQGDVTAQLGGLVGKVLDVGGSGKGSLTRQEFEGLSRDATATALEGDRGCRERVFNKMFDKLSAEVPEKAVEANTARSNAGAAVERAREAANIARRVVAQNVRWVRRQAEDARARALEAQSFARAQGQRTRNGYGVSSFEGGDRYEGEWHDGWYDGYGVYSKQSGFRYEGEWREGRFGGYGILTEERGDRREGKWRDDGLIEYAAMIFVDGWVYECEVERRACSGYGVATSPDGWRYEGQWRESRFNGYGVATYSDGSSYEGEWRDGNRKGWGRYVSSDGTVRTATP